MPFSIFDFFGLFYFYCLSAFLAFSECPYHFPDYDELYLFNLDWKSRRWWWTSFVQAILFDLNTTYLSVPFPILWCLILIYFSKLDRKSRRRRRTGIVQAVLFDLERTRRLSGCWTGKGLLPRIDCWMVSLLSKVWLSRYFVFPRF